MDKFKDGTIVFHKASGKRCVVISLNEKDNIVKVRTDKHKEEDFYPQELETLAEIQAKPPKATGGLVDNPDPFE